MVVWSYKGCDRRDYLEKYEVKNFTDTEIKRKLIKKQEINEPRKQGICRGERRRVRATLERGYGAKILIGGKKGGGR